MPKPTIGSGPAYVVPPVTGNPQLDEYLLMVHHHLYNLDLSGGFLDNDNINSGSLTGVLHANLASATNYQHHGANLHKDLDQGAASTNATASTVAVAAADATIGVASTVSVTTADADATYDAAERDLINELKADLNTLVTNMNTLVTAYNTSKTLANEMKSDIGQVVTDLNAVVTSLNDLKAKLRTAKVLAT